MKHTSTTHFILLSVIILAFSCKGKTENKKEFSEETIAVKVAPVKALGTSSTITATGLISTENEAKYAFKIGGLVDKIYVNEGDFFKRGKLLATLKLTEIEAQTQQASLAYEKAKRDYTRTNNLYKDSVSTLEQLQNAGTALHIAGKTVEAVNFNKKYAYIYAVSDGFVTKKIVSEGEVINAGSPVFAINETNAGNPWNLRLGVTDKEWAAISIGQTARVTIDAFPLKAFSGRVFRKSQAADQANGSFQIEIKLDAGNSKLAVGMFAKATIASARQQSLPTIPYAAVIEANGNNAFVFTPVNNYTVKRVPVVIESFNNNEVTIKSGLENVQQVVVSNSAFLNENSVINIVE